MLVLSRKACEQIQIGEDVVVTVLQVKGQTVRIGIEAPKNIRILRSELPSRETSDGAQESEAATKASAGPLKFCVTRRTLQAAHLGKVCNSKPTSPLGSHLDARRNLPLSLAEPARDPQRMEVGKLRLDSAVRSTSLLG
ncbi:MAG: carbon storage regulator CsrA [Pirellulales bacterium]|nr:carbon storage regulator CsrA [Pirellulales bacterium]